MKNYVSILIFSLLFLAINSCSKEIVEVCKKRYVSSVTVWELPDGFDLFGDPDLRCDIAPDASSYWSFPSYSVDNVSGLPITISFENEVLLSEESWAVRLIDEDPLGEEIIYGDIFNPYEHENNVIPLYKDGIKVMDLNYTESE